MCAVRVRVRVRVRVGSSSECLDVCWCAVDAAGDPRDLLENILDGLVRQDAIRVRVGVRVGVRVRVRIRVTLYTGMLTKIAKKAARAIRPALA